jgi:hypothetical protein
MPDATVIIAILKAGGPIAVVLIVWLLHNRQQNKLWEKMLTDNSEHIAKIIDLNQQTSAANTDVLKGLLETTQVQAGQLAEIKLDIRLNQYCPIIRGDLRKNEYRLNKTQE